MAHRELLSLRGVPILCAEQPEVCSLHELVHVLQKCHLLLVQVLRGRLCMHQGLSHDMPCPKPVYLNGNMPGKGEALSIRPVTE